MAEQIKLNRLKVYLEDPTKDGTPDNLVVELNGQKLDSVVGLSYNIGRDQLPVAVISLLANPDIEADVQTETDIVQF